VVVVTTTALVILCRLASVWEMIEDRSRRLTNDLHHRAPTLLERRIPSIPTSAHTHNQTHHEPSTDLSLSNPNRPLDLDRACHSYSYIAPISSNRAIVPSSHQHTLLARMYTLAWSRYQAEYARKFRYRPTVFGRRLSSDRTRLHVRCTYGETAMLSRKLPQRAAMGYTLCTCIAALALALTRSTTLVLLCF
jgi:hypothetical protein